MRIRSSNTHAIIIIIVTMYDSNEFYGILYTKKKQLQGGNFEQI